MAKPATAPKTKTKADKAASTKADKTDSKALVKAPKSKHQLEVAEVEILPPEEKHQFLKHPNDETSLCTIESSIMRDIQLSAKLDKAGAMVSVKIGLALIAGKAMLRHGQYDSWVSSKFGSVFSDRKARYYSKLADVFLTSTEGGKLLIPPPREAGNWLVVSDEGSQLQQSVEAFVGDMTFAELLDKHRIKPAKQKGGWRPAAWLVKQYQEEEPHLANRPYEVWTQEDKEAFKVWQEKQIDMDDSAAERMAAEGTWHKIRELLSEHGIGRKSWAMLPKEEQSDMHDILVSVARDIKKVLG